MNIIVCIKPVPYQLSVNSDGTILRNKIKNVINPLDKNALEEALRLKDIHGGNVTTISMGIQSAVNVLRDAYALGVDNSILLNDQIFAGSDTNATSYILSCAVNKIKDYDLIICGNHTSDSGTGQVALELAAKLDIAFATNVVETKMISDDIIECKSITDDGYLTVQLQLPALITVNKDINIPRIAPIKKLLESNEKEIKILTSNDLDINIGLCGLNGSPTRVTSINSLPSKENNCEILTGNINEKVNKLKKVLNTNATDKKESIYNSFETYEINNDKEVFVYCEINNNGINENTKRLLSKGRELAIRLKTNIVAVVINKNDEIIKELFKYGANKIYQINSDSMNYYLNSLEILDLVDKYKPEIFLFSKTFNSKIISAYIASKLGTGLAADCVDVLINEENVLIQKRVVYGGTKVADIICPTKRPQIATTYGNIAEIIYNESNTGSIIKIEEKNYDSKIKIINYKKDKEENICNSKVIITAGSGVNNIELVKELANKLNANVGFSRKMIDNGLGLCKYQIGLTGNYVKPKIYMALGVSGAVEHMAGVNSDIIIAINNDENAPIFKYSNYGIIADVNEIIPLLIKEMEEY